MIKILENYNFTNYMGENKTFVRGSHRTNEDKNYKYAPHISGVYIIKHIPTGYFYVGNSSNIGRRLSHHFGKLNRNVHECFRLQELYNNNKYEDFKFKYTIIDNKDERIKLEQYLLNEETYSDKMLNTVTVNNTWVNERNHAMVETYKNTLSEIASQKTGELNPFYGKRHSEETKEKLRQYRMGTENTSAHSPVVINGVYYKSQQYAGEVLGVNSSTISFRVRSDSAIYCNYYAPKNKDDIFVVDEDLIFDPKLKTVKNIFIINNVKYFSSKDIAKEYNVTRDTVYWRIRSTNKKFDNWKKII